MTATDVLAVMRCHIANRADACYAAERNGLPAMAQDFAAARLDEAIDASCAVAELIEALREVVAINDEDPGTFRKRGGTRRGLSITVARAALASVGGGK